MNALATLDQLRSPGEVNPNLILGDAFNWLENAEPNSIHAVVTDPPYGLVEYTPN